MAKKPHSFLVNKMKKIHHLASRTAENPQVCLSSSKGDTGAEFSWSLVCRTRVPAPSLTGQWAHPFLMSEGLRLSLPQLSSGKRCPHSSVNTGTEVLVPCQRSQKREGSAGLSETAAGRAVHRTNGRKVRPALTCDLGRHNSTTIRL